MTYNYYGKLNSQVVFAGGIDQFVRWRVQLMEKAIALIDLAVGREEVVQVYKM